MKYQKYSVRASDGFRRFNFVSEGPKGRIAKMILFQETEIPLISNLAFGDTTQDDEFNDSVVTDNRDTAKVLATVASTAKTFLKAHPGERVLFKGSSEARTRLYRMAISKTLTSLEKDLISSGLQATDGKRLSPIPIILAL